jgi:hypothetical protein
MLNHYYIHVQCLVDLRFGARSSVNQRLRLLITFLQDEIGSAAA